MRLRRSAVVALALSSAAVVAVPAPALAAKRLTCGALRRSAVYGIRAEAVRCPEARTLAIEHERSAKRGSACAFRRGFCRVRRFSCIFRVGMKPRPKDGLVTCVAGRDRQVTFHYDARKVRLPPPPNYDPPPPPEEPPPAETPPAA